MNKYNWRIRDDQKPSLEQSKALELGRLVWWGEENAV